MWHGVVVRNGNATTTCDPTSHGLMKTSLNLSTQSESPIQEEFNDSLDRVISKYLPIVVLLSFVLFNFSWLAVLLAADRMTYELRLGENDTSTLKTMAEVKRKQTSPCQLDSAPNGLSNGTHIRHQWIISGLPWLRDHPGSTVTTLAAQWPLFCSHLAWFFRPDPRSWHQVPLCFSL